MKSFSILFLLSSLLFQGASTFSQDDNFDFEIYPNPFDDRLHMEIVSNSGGNINISLWNTLGQNVATIFEFYCSNPPCGRIMPIFDVPNYFPTGVYFYMVKLDERVIKTGKLVLIQW
jgi:hypothetical protein